MPKLSLDDLKKLREESKKEIEPRIMSKDSTKITVGMGVSGIKAGAKEVLNTFLDEVKKRELVNIIVKQDGSEEIYGAEPVVEIHIPKMGKIKYKEVTSEIAIEILEQHVLNNKILKQYLYNEPA